MNTELRDLGEGLKPRYAVYINKQLEAVFVRSAAARAYARHIERKVKGK